MNHSPTVSVLLPCHNEEKLLPRQLAAIVPQLLATDELVLLDDGSTDATVRLMLECRKANKGKVQTLSRYEPLGVNAAYNLCAFMATGDFVIGASGNDIMQPGALAAFRKAYEAIPGKVFYMGRKANCGHHYGEKVPTYYSPQRLLTQWERWAGHRLHGCSSFIKRELFTYKVGKWIADWILGWTLAARHGIVHMPESIAWMSKPGWSESHLDDEQYNAAIAECREYIFGKECDDIRAHVDAYEGMFGFMQDREPMFFFSHKNAPVVDEEIEFIED